MLRLRTPAASPARITPLLLLLLAVALGSGCADEARPPRPPPSPPVDTTALLAELHAANPRLVEAARAIVATRDPRLLQGASQRLLAAAATLRSPEWRAGARAELQRANAHAGISPTDAQLEAQTDAYREQRLEAVLSAMGAVGGAAIVAHCFALGEDASAPLPLRFRAVDVLVKVLDRRDQAAMARAEALWNQLLTRPPSTPVGPSGAPGNVANAAAVVAAMQPAFRSCYNSALLADPGMKGSVRLTARIGPEGEVTTVSPSGGGGLSPPLVACLESVVAHARFAAPEGGGATIVIPITFVATP